MDNYKAVISNKELYLEVELQKIEPMIRIGTVPGCKIRLNKDRFFDDFWIQFTDTDNGWRISCSDRVYIYCGDVRKLSNKSLNNGELISIRYQESNALLFEIEYGIDFNNEQRKYQRAIDIKNRKILNIGTENSNQIILGSTYTPNETIRLTRNSEGVILSPIKSTYGVCVNGTKIQKDVVIRDSDFFSVADFIFCYKNGLLWTEIREDFQVNGISYYDCPDVNTYPRFVRNTRERTTVNKEKIEILVPPSKPSKPRNNIVTNLLPSMGMLATSGIMAAMGSAMMGYSLISGGMAIVIAVATLIQNSYDYKKDVKERIEKYNSYVDRKRKEISGLRSVERAELKKIYIDTTEKERRLSEFSRDLFDRMPTDPDFLDVRLGTGIVKALREIEYKHQDQIETDDELQRIPQQIAEEFEMLENAPAVCHLKDSNSIGIIGSQKCRYEMMKNIIYDLCIRQYISDLSLFFIARPEHAELIRKFRFLPQVNNTNVGFRCLVCDDESKNRVFDVLYQALVKRKEDEPAEHIIVFFYDDYEFQTHPASKYLLNAREHHTTFVFMAEEKGSIPIGCSQHIYVNEDNTGHMLNTADNHEDISFFFKPIEDSKIDKMISMLAPVHTEELSLESALTKNITLFELLKIAGADDLNLKKRWGESKVYNSMAAPIGITKSETVYLDLHDKAHGPHGLVAGTTGSGKSELLQTYILSVATCFHPYEVGFVIIDFKGGGMVNQFKDLPHLLGAITNIDGKETDRSLRFIKAELKKRQWLLAEANVNHIDRYIKLYKAGEVDVPLPHLVLIVDEFAELKADYPDFMQELISAARIGRSLGVHLILATQKPAGQVDDQIWSNSRFKICLKVQGPDDSNEVLKSPLAAEIKEPGRAYFQVGNNEIFELFQSAYSGAPERIGDNSTKEFTIYKVGTSGIRTPIFTQKCKIEGESENTQLDAIVEYINQYCANEGIEQLSAICLPPLMECVVCPKSAVKPGAMIDIGIYDDPDNQSQESAKLDIDSKNTFVLGSSQYGKTNLLQTIIRTIAESGTPMQSVIYILDFGSMVLKNFERLNHVGGVVTSSEDEKLKNLFKLLFTEMAERKARILEAGVSSHAAYREAGFEDLPHIYLLVDNFAALMELFLEDDDSLLILLREGIAVGISVIITNSITAGVNFRYMSNFANKIAFFCNDSGEYMSLFDQVTLQPDGVPGRCILEIEKRLLECQTYLAFAGEKEFDRVRGINDWINAVNGRNGNSKAKKIPSIPKVLEARILAEDFFAVPSGYYIPIGITYEGVDPYYLDLFTLGSLGICGKDGTGHRNFVEYILNTLMAGSKTHPVRIVIFDDITRKYANLKGNPLVERYVVGSGETEVVFREWHDILESRYEKLEEEGVVGSDNELLLMIIQNNDVAKELEADMELQELYNDFSGRFSGLGLVILFVNYPNASISYDAPEALRQIKEQRHLLFFGDLDNLKPFDVAYEDAHRYRKKLEKGDAYYIRDNEVVKLKMVKAKNQR